MAVPKPSACFLSLELIKALLNDPSSVKTDEVRAEPQVLGEGVKGEQKGPTCSVQPILLSVCQSQVLRILFLPGFKTRIFF